MLSSKFVQPASLVIGAGTALSAFGVASPAMATTDCSGVTPIDSTELALRDALDRGDTLICINAGTINFGSSGVDSDSGNVSVGYDVTIVGIGNVVFDGDDTSMSALITSGDPDIDLQVENITFQNFYSESEVYPGVVGAWTSGTITVIDSTFQMNTGYAMVGGVDILDTPDDGDFADLVVTDSVFVNNNTINAPVWGYADITVTGSEFISSNSQAAAAVQLENHDGVASRTLDFSRNYVGDTLSLESGIVTAVESTVNVTNNTFYNNDYEYAGVEFMGGSNGVVAFNTFVDNDSNLQNPNVRISDLSEFGILGNIFVTQADESGVDEDAFGVLVDQGGNFTTSDDSQYLTDETSHNEVVEADLELDDSPSDNGGFTDTFALGANSIALNAVTASDAEFALEYTLGSDQRGETRGELLDAGAWDDGLPAVSGLAATGVDATGIALTGGALAIGGVAIAARRRRSKA